MNVESVLGIAGILLFVGGWVVLAVGDARSQRGVELTGQWVLLTSLMLMLAEMTESFSPQWWQAADGPARLVAVILSVGLAATAGFLLAVTYRWWRSATAGWSAR